MLDDGTMYSLASKHFSTQKSVTKVQLEELKIDGISGAGIVWDAIMNREAGPAIPGTRDNIDKSGMISASWESRWCLRMELYEEFSCYLVCVRQRAYLIIIESV